MPIEIVNLRPVPSKMSSSEIECVHCGHFFAERSLRRHLKGIMGGDSEDDDASSDDNEGDRADAETRATATPGLAGEADDSAAVDWPADPPAFDDEPLFAADMNGHDGDAPLRERPEWAADSDAESESEAEEPGEGGDGASDASDDHDEDPREFAELYQHLPEKDDECAILLYY